ARFKDGTGLPTGAMGSSVFVPAVGNSGTQVQAIGQTSLMTPAVPAGGVGRYVLVGVLALVAAGGGAALHWAQTPPPATVNPDDALADVDRPPSAVREGELKRHIHDKD